RLALEGRIPLEVGLDLIGNDRDVGSEGVGGQGNLHELYNDHVSQSLFRWRRKTGQGNAKYLLLLHELRVGAVVDHIPSEDRGGQASVDFFGVDVLELAVEDEVVSRRSHGDRGL